MTPIPSDTVTVHNIDDEMLETAKPEYSRQSSSKRRNPDYNNEEDADDEILSKRVRPTTNNTIVCPIAKFGCLSSVPCDNLQEHYSSEIHQKYLMSAMDAYIRQLHMGTTNHAPITNNEENYSEVLESVNILAEGVSCLHDDSVQIQHNVVQNQKTILDHQKQLQLLKSSVEETVQVTNAIQMNNNIVETELETLKQMMKDLLTQSSNDGTFLWKITDVGKKISDALSERQTSVYSPPFYSSPTGYKMCMRLYFNGDGNARRTHLSLFFVLMRGDYDAVLEWPFSQKITFCLYDQTRNQRHIIDSFRPDAKSNSFQRPRSNMNIASGLPKFCPIPTIQQDNNPYVVDDCMFIRCMVDFESAPKQMLPYVCSLNPGLPTAIRRIMIQTEIDRLKAQASQDSSPKIESPK